MQEAAPPKTPFLFLAPDKKQKLREEENHDTGEVDDENNVILTLKTKVC